MKKGYLAALATVLLLGASSLAQAAPFTFNFSLLPAGGAIKGEAGALTGWGYRIENQDGINWFVATDISASSFALGVPDASFFDFPIIGPGAFATQAFDAALLTGLFGVNILAGALPGQSEGGVFTLGGEWWSGDPLGAGSFLRVADPATGAFSLTVIGGPTVVPEPSTFWLLVFALPLLARRVQSAR